MTVQDFVLKSPILESCGFSSSSVREDWAFWEDVAARIIDHLKTSPEEIESDAFARSRVYQYYLPVFMWCHKQLVAHRASHSETERHPPALVIGISAPQGCGKSTIVACLQDVFNSLGSAAASISIDDFYLRFEDQTKLGETNPGNALVQFRGNAGTHDVHLGTDTLASLRDLTESGRKVSVPRYDKSKNQGRGDRADPSEWPTVEGPLSVVLFEGWMLGFRPIGVEDVVSVDPNLEFVNNVLLGYEEAWDRFVDCWFVVKVADPDYVFRWRLQAEHAMQKSGRPGMTDDQVKDFVSRFMPAYKAYLPGLYSKGPTTAVDGKTLMIEVDEHRALVNPKTSEPS